MNLSPFGDELVKISKASARELFTSLRKSSPVVVHVDPKDRIVELAGGGYYDQGSKIVVRDRDHHILAHEVGHAKVDENLLGRLIQSKPSRIIAHLSAPAALVSGMLTRTPKGKVLSVVVPVAATLPTLGSEAWASIKGHSLLEEGGASKADLEKYKERMTKAFLTYVSLPVGAAINAGAGIILGASNS